MSPLFGGRPGIPDSWFDSMLRKRPLRKCPERFRPEICSCTLSDQTQNFPLEAMTPGEDNKTMRTVLLILTSLLALVGGLPSQGNLPLTRCAVAGEQAEMPSCCGKSCCRAQNEQGCAACRTSSKSAPHRVLTLIHAGDGSTHNDGCPCSSQDCCCRGTVGPLALPEPLHFAASHVSTIVLITGEQLTSRCDQPLLPPPKHDLVA